MERLIFDTHSHYMDDAFAEDRDAVLQALTYSKEITAAGGNTVEYHVVDFLKGGEGYLQPDHQTYANTEINLGDLIVYENWQKQ